MIRFIGEMAWAVAYGVVALVIAVFAAAILMEAYDWLIDTWGLLFG